MQRKKNLFQPSFLLMVGTNGLHSNRWPGHSLFARPPPATPKRGVGCNSLQFAYKLQDTRADGVKAISFGWRSGPWARGGRAGVRTPRGGTRADYYSPPSFKLWVFPRSSFGSHGNPHVPFSSLFDVDKEKKYANRFHYMHNLWLYWYMQDFICSIYINI